MKIKITLIVAQKKLQAEMGDEAFFRVFFTDDKGFPSTYITTKDERETLKTLIDQYFHCSINWMSPELFDFRKCGDGEFEVVYSCYTPFIYDMNKTGIFLPEEQLEENNIEIDPYYEKLLSTKSRGF